MGNGEWSGDSGKMGAAFNISSDLNYCNKKEIEQPGFLMTKCFKMLSGLIESCNKKL